MPDTTALDTEYRAFREHAGAVWLPRDFLRASGPDALTFLQGQLSQDVDLEVGGSAWALLLQPQGKVVALLRVLRETEDSFVLDTDAGFGAAVTERLNRFKLRTRCELEPLEWQCLAVRGPDAVETVTGTGARSVVADWPGLPGRDLVGEAPEVPNGAPICSLDAYEAVRIEAGIPVMGRELDERTIPAEAGVVVEQSVSFTKGCYTGQELVARIDSRGGKVPKNLRGIVVVSGQSPPPPGATVRTGDRDAGNVTSVAYSPGFDAPVALAYVGRAVSPPADVELRWDGGSLPAQVKALPLIG